LRTPQLRFANPSPEWTPRRRDFPKKFQIPPVSFSIPSSQAFIERLVGGLGLDHSGRRRASARVEAERIFTGAAHAGLMH
jgi:hypothetical protein